jgi:hypothetical protein
MCAWSASMRRGSPRVSPCLLSIAGTFPKFSDEQQTISGHPCFCDRAKAFKHHLEALQTHATGGEGSGSCADVPAVLENDKGEVVMITQSKNMSRFLLMLGALLLCLPFSARAQNASEYVELTNAVDVGQTQSLVLLGHSSTDSFVVPAGMVLVLTDFIISPQLRPVSGTVANYTLNVSSTWSSTGWSSVILDSSSSEPSSFRFHLTTGMMIQSGAQVNASLSFGPSAVNFMAFGRLLPQ